MGKSPPPFLSAIFKTKISLSSIYGPHGSCNLKAVAASIRIHCASIRQKILLPLRLMGCSNKRPADAIKSINKTHMQELLGWWQPGKNVFLSSHLISLEGALRPENSISKYNSNIEKSLVGLDLVGKSITNKNCMEDAMYLLVGQYAGAVKGSSDLYLVIADKWAHYKTAFQA